MVSHKQLELTDHPVSVIVFSSQPINTAREGSVRAIPLSKPHPMLLPCAPSESQPSDQTALETANMVGTILSNITYGMNVISSSQKNTFNASSLWLQVSNSLSSCF